MDEGFKYVFPYAMIKPIIPPSYPESMATKTFELSLPKTVEGDVVEITGDVQQLVAQSGVAEGIVLVFVPGSTGALSTIEYEPGLIEDINVALERLAPRSARYGHEERWHDGNGHSHVKATVMGPGITVPIGGGRLTLGTWQQLVFLELDNKPRTRRLIVKITGD